MAPQNNISALIGLGNPGPKFVFTRHNIGFRVLDALADNYHASWHTKGNAEIAQIALNDRTILLVKPVTFMNSSGQVLPQLAKQGIKKENILVVHDELELPFGKLKVRTGGSAKGHNGLRSIIETIGPEFMRLSVGIDRPLNREEVPDYVLSRFRENEQQVEQMIQQAVIELEKIIS
jgi:PTH1 family peptidyl-tRNA hydrolase